MSSLLRGMRDRWLARVLLGSRGEGFSQAGFESLEGRLFLSAPAAQILSTSMGSVDWVITVKYTDPAGIDLSSIGNGDIRVTAAARTSAQTPQAAYSELGMLVQAPTTFSDGSVVAKYSVAARGGAWDWADSASYKVSSVAEQVRNGAGQWNAAADLNTYSLWYTIPHAEVVSATLRNTSTWLIGVKITDDQALDMSTIGSGDLEVYGPGGTKGGISIGRLSHVMGSGNQVTAYYFAKVAQVSSSWMDQGGYTVVLRPGQIKDMANNAAPTFTMATPSFEGDRPSAQLVSSSFSASAWTVSVRYRSRIGIDVSSIGNGDLEYTSDGVSTLAMLSGSPVVSSDGSVVATYTLAAPGGGWVSTPGAYTLAVRASQVFESAIQLGEGSRLSVLSGYLVNGSGMVTAPAETVYNPTTASLGGVARVNATTWDVAVRFTDVNGVNASSLTSGQALMAYGPLMSSTGGAFRSTLTVKWAVQETGTTWFVGYRLTSASTFTPGSYYLRTGLQEVRDGLGNIMPSIELLAFTL